MNKVTWWWVYTEGRKMGPFYYRIEAETEVVTLKKQGKLAHMERTDFYIH